MHQQAADTVWLKEDSETSPDWSAPRLTHPLRLHTPLEMHHALTRAHTEESPPVWVFKIKTNADESSFCEARQCSAAGVVLLQQREIQYGLL